MRTRLLILAVFIIGLLAGSGMGIYADRIHLVPGSPYYEPQSVVSVFSPFWQAWDLVGQHFVDQQAVNPTNMTYGAIEGMLDSLGDTGHTRFMSPKDLKAEEDALSGHLEGIGAEISSRNGQPTIVAPIPGSPAQKAGIRAGDTIVRVNGQEVTGLTVDEIANMIRGPAGTSVTVTVIHPGDTIFVDITVVRASITVPNVTWAQLPGTQDAHILVSQFGNNCTQDLLKALGEVQSRKLAGIVLDLRNDPGGLRDEAVGVASQFLNGGDVLIEQDAKGNKTRFPVQPGGAAQDIPLVVLINEGTASSAEIVAGAIQDHKRGPLAGTTTFGTGTVLSQFGLGDGSAIWLGTEEWLTPNGRQIWHHGITPDIPVSLPNNALPLIPDQEAGMTHEQLVASQDAQLLRALEELLKASGR